MFVRTFTTSEMYSKLFSILFVSQSGIDSLFLYAVNRVFSPLVADGVGADGTFRLGTHERRQVEKESK